MSLLSVKNQHFNVAKTLSLILLASILAFTGNIARAEQRALIERTLIERTMCVWDPAGSNGPTFQAMKSYRSAALDWGVRLKLIPYSDPTVASDDFKAEACDIVNAPGIVTRNFNQFTGSIDSIGSIPTYDHLKTVLQTLTTDKATKYMVVGDYETVSILPGGTVYIFTNDKTSVSVKKLAGKKMPILEDVPEARIFAEKTGMTPVSASLANAFSKFNNNAVDVIAGPALVFEALELFKGLGENGGIVKFPLLQLTQQMVSRHARFPEGFGAKSRAYSISKFEESLALSKSAEQRIPEKYWINLSEEDRNDWMEVYKASRKTFREEGIYNATLLKLLWSIRCREMPSLAECSAKDRV